MSAGWQTKSLGDVLEIQNGYAFDSKRFSTSKGLPLVRIRSLKNGVEKDTFFDGAYDDKYVVSDGDLLIGMDGEFGCFEWKGGKALLNQRVCRLQNFDSQLLPRFLFYGVNDYLKAIEDVTGFATVKHLSSKQVLDIEFPVPSMSEQQRIVAILDAAFAEIAAAKANAERNLQNARALFESYLNKVFTERGDGWQTVPFGEIAAFRNGINFTKSSRGTPIKILGVKDFQNHYWAQFEDFDSIVPEGLVPDPDTLIEGDIVFVRSNGNPDLIGRCLLIGQLPERTTHSGFTIKARLQQDSVLPAYLCHFLKLKDTRQEMIDGGNGANIKSLNQGTLSRIVVPFPSLSKQAEIVRQLEDMQVETQRLESIYQKKLAALDELKKSLLHQAFSGAL